MMDSSRASKFSMHLSCNFYFDEWKNQCEFVKLGYSDIMVSQNIRNDRDRVMDGTIYSEGGRAMRLIGSTKFSTVLPRLKPHGGISETGLRGSEILRSRIISHWGIIRIPHWGITRDGINITCAC